MVKKDQRNSLPFQPSLMSFCTQGLPEVAESTFQNAKDNLLPGEKVPARADEGWGKVLFPGPHPPSDSPPAPGIKGLFFGGWILRLRHSAPRRMTGGEAYSED